VANDKEIYIMDDFSETETLPFTGDNLARERAKDLFQRLKYLNPLYEVELYSAKQIQSCYRSYKIRSQFNEIRRLRLAKSAIFMQLNTLTMELGLTNREEKNAVAKFLQEYVQ